MNLHFTYESRDTLKSFSLFLNVKTNTKLNMEHVQRYVRKRNFEKSRRRSHSLDNAKFGHFMLFFFFFAEDAKKFAKIYDARAQLLFCLLNLLFSEVSVAVSVAVSVLVFLNSLILTTVNG